MHSFNSPFSALGTKVWSLHHGVWLVPCVAAKVQGSTQVTAPAIISEERWNLRDLRVMASNLMMAPNLVAKGT